MVIQRHTYLEKLIARKHNKLIKVITGIRRSGKSFLLFNLFKSHLANKGSQRYYIQSAFALPDDEKIRQEERPLINVSDSFKKIVVVKDNILLRRNEDGITTMGLKQFLLDSNSLDL